MTSKITSSLLELKRNRDIIQPLRNLLEKELIDGDYVRALYDMNKISQEELFKILN